MYGTQVYYTLGILGGASDKESTCQCSIPGSGRSTGGGHGNPLQYPCLENPMERNLVGYIT